MMKLCPIKYGVKYVAPTGSWALTNSDAVYEADFGLTTVNTLVSGGSTYGGHLHVGQGYLFSRRSGNFPVRYASTGNLTSWTATATSMVADGNMTSDAGFLYIVGGTGQIFRGMDLSPIGDQVGLGDGSSTLNNICLKGGNFYGVFSNDIKKSTTGGASFSIVLNDFMAGAPVGQSAIVSDGGSRMVVFAADGVSELTAKYTDDDFATLSANQISDTVSGAEACQYSTAIYDGSYFVCILETGECYRSTNGESPWAKSTIPTSTSLSGISHGGDRIVAVSSTSPDAYYSDDHGATWSTVTTPTGLGYTDVKFIG